MMMGKKLVDDRLDYLRNKLRCGEYDGTDIMTAWIALESLDIAQLRIIELETMVGELIDIAENKKHG